MSRSRFVELEVLDERVPGLVGQEVVRELEARDLTAPMVLRFSDILRDRLRSLHDAFAAAIAENDYKNRYAAVYPIKVNQQRLVVEEASERVYNFLTALTMELQMLARACGKTNVHSLEPEDLAALTVEASAMARVPLAGTTYTVGQTEREILSEVQRLLAIKAEEELVAGQAAEVAELKAVDV